jgi:hypothetical protein
MINGRANRLEITFSVLRIAHSPYQASSALDERMNLLLGDSPGGTIPRMGVCESTDAAGPATAHGKKHQSG